MRACPKATFGVLWEKNQVVKQMAGIEVHNLRLIGKLSDGDQNADIQGCRPIK